MVSRQDLFGVLVPGYPVAIEFNQIDEKKFIINIPNPKIIDRLTFFLLPTFPAHLLDACCCVVYYTLPPGDKWSMLGSVSGRKPSAIFETGWTTKPEFASAPMIQLCISFESIEFEANVDNDVKNRDIFEKQSFGIKIAKDLFKYMQSFAKSSDSGAEYLLVPSNVMDRWIEKFRRKIQLDPGALYRENDV